MWEWAPILSIHVRSLISATLDEILSDINYDLLKELRVFKHKFILLHRGQSWFVHMHWGWLIQKFCIRNLIVCLIKSLQGRFLKTLIMEKSCLCCLWLLQSTHSLQLNKLIMIKSILWSRCNLWRLNFRSSLVLSWGIWIYFFCSFENCWRKAGRRLITLS